MYDMVESEIRRIVVTRQRQASSIIASSLSLEIERYGTIIRYCTIQYHTTYVVHSLKTKKQHTVSTYVMMHNPPHKGAEERGEDDLDSLAAVRKEGS
jgi:hypothetical protein